jgi:hypothetical protein
MWVSLLRHTSDITCGDEGDHGIGEWGGGWHEHDER